MASRLSTDASALYAKNLFNLLALMIKDKELATDWDDDIIEGIALTKGGAIIHPSFTDKKAPAKKATKKTAKKSAKKATKKAVKKTAKKSTKKAVKKAPQKTVKTSAKKEA